MQKKIEYRIMAHENGWAVVVGDILRAVYPSRHIALTAVKLLENEKSLAEEAVCSTAEPDNRTLTDTAGTNRFPASFQVMVAVPYQVDIPLRRRSAEVSFPSSIDGHDLTAGKV
ncbi:hypothetical protein [Agrobacterium sp. V1]|uniref:hypothetical protein n=1 Tax=Agrobacterium sp. V1 TaxID=3061957 RepID=UPI002672B958|nr:hypothetical protein [Agrobacterium sp. V1]MDO3445532.1 hypothetical protein [Agrobacterium sp. V1]